MSRIRYALRQSRTLRKAVNEARRILQTRSQLLVVRHIPEDAFKEQLRRNLMRIIEIEGRESIGDYLEFGVFNGRSLACAYETFQDLGLKAPRLIGFDSFAGLPPEADTDDAGIWLPGQYSCPLDVTIEFLHQRQVDLGRVLLVEGWFNETLNTSTIAQHDLKKASVVMVDCDLYSSTVTVLEFVESLIHGRAIIIFDDWYTCGLAGRNMGEKKAFEEFLTRHPDLEATECGSYNDNSLVFQIERPQATRT